MSGSGRMTGNGRKKTFFLFIYLRISIFAAVFHSFNVLSIMKKIFAMVVMVAAMGMVACCGNGNKKAAEAAECCEQTECCEAAEECCEAAEECCGEAEEAIQEAVEAVQDAAAAVKDAAEALTK